MIALPSIAFEGFSGSAKGVTARRVGGRNILSVKSRPTGPTTNAQVVRRASMAKISKSWKQLTSDQMRDWGRFAEHASGASVLGKKAEISGLNLYIRLNVNRAMAGEPLMTNAPLHTMAVPNVEYEQVVVPPRADGYRRYKASARSVQTRRQDVEFPERRYLQRMEQNRHHYSRNGRRLGRGGRDQALPQDYRRRTGAGREGFRSDLLARYVYRLCWRRPPGPLEPKPPTDRFRSQDEPSLQRCREGFSCACQNFVVSLCRQIEI